MSIIEKKRMLIAAPLDYREDFRLHFSARGFSTRYAQSQSFLVNQINQSIETDLLYDTIILDVTYDAIDIDEVLQTLLNKEEIADTKIVISAPDKQRGDAQMVLPLGGDRVLCYSELDSFELNAHGKLRRVHRKRPDVLVVDDDPASVKVITFFLEKEGCTFDCAHSGKEALKLYASRQYDAVFLDLMMPGIDGFEFAMLVRDSEQNQSRIPIIAVTALEEEYGLERCRSIGMDAFVPKPISAITLRNVLKELVTDTLLKTQPSSNTAPMSSR
jgi:CheY-like chemotaxis protein